MSEVNHPKHYNDGKIEVIEFIEDKKLGFHLGNAVKYIARAGKKDPSKTIQDLEKAIWYIKRQIETFKDDPRRPNDMNPRTDYPVPPINTATEREVCPQCNSMEFFVRKDMTSTRVCIRCSKQWECPK